MDCRHVRELVDAMAGGDAPVTEDARVHLESCPSCAAALAAASRIEAMLAAREAPEPPGRFTASVLHRMRRDRWTAEQRVDRLFNAAIVLGFAVIVGGIGALLNLSGMLAAANTVWSAVTTASQNAARQAVPTLVTYIAAAGLLVSALVTWWWAERKLTW